MENITPPFLKRGDTIGVIAPSRFISHEIMQTAIHFFTSHGFVLKTAPHLFSQHFQFSGTDTERAHDFNEMIEDKNVKAIVCARGGYGIVRILDELKLRPLQLNPKWIIGNGDVTLLHSLINSWYGIETMQALMPKDYPHITQGNEACEIMINILMGGLPTYTVPHNPLNKIGKVEGTLTGGNLLSLVTQIGTDCDFSAQDKILFIENSKSMLYDVDRMMMQLKRSGRLKVLKGLIVGTFSDIHDSQIPFGLNSYEIINNICKDYDFPICFGFEAGRGSQNLPLIMGRKVSLEVDSRGAKVQFLNPSSKNNIDKTQPQSTNED